MSKFIAIFLFISTLIEAKSLTTMISNMIIIGFEGEKVPKHLADFIQKNGIGGVILFKKNIKNPLQLRALTKALKSLDGSIMIAIDQEGGLVERLEAKNGFFDTPKPIEIAKMGEKKAKILYTKMAKMLHDNGINVNFAPSVDLAKNPKNRVIYGYGRAFSKDSEDVITYANIFIKAMEKEGVVSVIKHFPGHGSSLADSHRGFVDVSKTWSREELEPFMKLPAKAVMSAHIFNKHLDTTYPATLSKKTLSLLRHHGFDGVIISDDLQMKAITENFDFNQTLSSAVNASVDMLLFGNQLSKPIMIDRLVEEIKALVKVGKISKEKIIEANQRIDKIKEEFNARR
jgi:beta-N-acetylhexosaminidase